MAAPPAPPLILASTSPRRREILEQLRIPFDIVVPSYEETSGDPVEHALGKARSVGPFDDRPVLGCDTEVICGGRVYGKPENEEDAEAMLESLAGKTHEVVSGLALITPAWEEVHREVTRVTFRPLDARDTAAHPGFDRGSQPQRERPQPAGVPSQCCPRQLDRGDDPVTRDCVNDEPLLAPDVRLVGVRPRVEPGSDPEARRPRRLRGE